MVHRLSQGFPDAYMGEMVPNRDTRVLIEHDDL